METQSHKIVAYQDEDFIISFDMLNGVPSLHCEVFKWTPKTLRRGLRVFAELEKQFKERGFNTLISLSPNPEFCRMLGAKSKGKFLYNDKEHEVMVWVLK